MNRLALLVGLVLLGIIWLGPLLAAWRESFAAHMVAHMGVIAIAAPLIAIGLPKSLRRSASIPTALPVIISLVELIAVWGWHAPILRAAAEGSTLVTIIEQATFLIVGVLLWWTSFGSQNKRTGAAAGAAAMLFTSIHMTLLGALLGLSSRPLYGTDEVTCFGLVLDAAQDQQLGAVVMLLLGAVIYLAGALTLVAKLLEQDAPTR